jgi:hypothetical protein
MSSPLGPTDDRRAISKAAFWRNVGYNPHDKQRLFHQSPARYRVAVCGRRFGKSKMAALDMLPELFVPDGNYWIIGPTYDLGEREFRVIWKTLEAHHMFQPDTGIRGTYNRANGKMWIEFPWGSRLEVRSADHPDSLVGDALHGVIMSEAAKMPPNIWPQYVQPALTDFRGWATFPTTPEGTSNWVYDLWMLGQDPEEPDYDSWSFPSWTNPYVYPLGEHDPEILSIKRSTATPIFQQEYEASFSAFQGQIYPEFKQQVHVAPVKFNPDWPNYIAWDFGFTNPLAAVEFQVDPMDRVWVWREHYDSGMTIPQHVEVMKSRVQPEGYRIDLMFGDAADPEAIMQLNHLMAPTVGDPKSKVNWREGIGMVKRFLLPRDAEAAEGTPGSEPSLKIDHKCEMTIREHVNYRGVEPGKSGLDPREAAKRSSDHTCDALRYGLMHVFSLGYRANGMSVALLNTLSRTPRDNGLVLHSGGRVQSATDYIRNDALVTAEGTRF